MSADPCPMELLVEALRDGRLSEREGASVHRHLATCATCAALAAELAHVGAALRLPPLSPLEHRRGRMRLLREAARPRLPPRRAPARLSLAIAALGGLALLGGGSALLARGAPAGAPALVAHLPPIARPAPARAETQVMPEDGARLETRAIGGVEIIALEDGAVRLSVRRLSPGERFLVTTGDAEVEVRGTVFRVEAQANRVRSVQVTEGIVEVRFRGRSWFVAANASWRPPAEEAAAAPAPEAAVLTMGAPPPNPPPQALRRASGAATSPGSPRPDPSATAREDDASTAFREGVGLADRGDYDAAARRLRAFSEAHPLDDRAEDAAFLVIASMHRAGRAAEVRAAARRYLVRYPNGFRRTEVQAMSDSLDAQASEKR